MKRNNVRLPVALASAALLVVGMAACSTGIEETTDGPGTTELSISDPAELKIAFFSSATNNTYLQAGIEGAKDAAAELGATVEIFDGEFSAQKQFDQIQSAITSGKYNAFVVEPNDGNLMCDILTKDAADAGILVSIINIPICGRETNLGDETHEPGTVTFVGGQTLDVYQAWVASVVEENPDGAKVALIAGPDLGANTMNFWKAAETFESTDGFELVAKQTTDYTTAQAFEAAQTIMQANPELDIIMSNYSGMTRGVLEAVAGTDVEVYDFGGDTWALEQIGNGSLHQTVVMLPYSETQEAVLALGDAVKGADVPPFINLTENPALPGTPFITDDNMNEFTPEY